MGSYYHEPQWSHPGTGESYDLSHCFIFNTTFNVKPRASKELISTPCRVYISSHCFTKKRPEDDEASITYELERKRDDSIEDRVFCPTRWEFSKKIPKIITNLEHKGCLGGKEKRIVYRQEEPKIAGSHEGWYICMTLNFSSNRGLELRVTSCHRRYNRPVDIRTHGTKKFYMFLNEFMEGKI